MWGSFTIELRHTARSELRPNFTVHHTVTAQFGKFELWPSYDANEVPLAPIGAVLNTETAMERLHFVCPSTGQDVDVGIDSELETLLRIRKNRVLARCPVCGTHHEWEVRDARLLLQAA